MDKLLQMIKNYTSIYKKNQDKFDYILKFIAGLFIFWRISLISSSHISFVIVMGLTFLFAALSIISSPITFLCLMGAASCFYISFISIEAAILAFAIYFVILVFYVRIFPKESLIIPIMMVAYFFKIPYIVPIAAGIYVGIRGIGAIVIAVFLHHNIILINSISEAVPKSDFTLMGILDNGIKMLETVANNFSIGWIFIAGVFSISLIASWIINNMFIDNEGTYASIISSVIMFVGLILCVFLTSADVSVIGAVIGIPISCVITVFMQKIDFVLDYPNAEKVKFQDDNYIYYVKAVPKIKR